ncbi:MAG: DNA-binding protein [Burkholderiales bacterium]|nr:DNA-binding protein [Burkholderiales bacterium]
MPRAPRLPHSTRPPRQTTDGRGINSSDVDRTADALLREGERPTIERIRARLGRGSPNTINPLLDTWWKRLAARLDAGPAALHRLPEPVLLAAEGLWMQTLDEARRRAAAEQGSRKASLAKDRQDLEVRSHVLSIRESELTSRLQDRDRRIAQLELELQTLVTVLRKEQASRAAADRRLAEVQDELQMALAPRGLRRSTVSAKRGTKLRKSARKSTRAKKTTKRKVTIRKSRRR